VMGSMATPGNKATIVLYWKIFGVWKDVLNRKLFRRR